MAYVNIIEIKARCANPQAIRDVLCRQNAHFRGTDRQTDTYFTVNHGRLKLREGTIENCLVYYQRQNHKGPKQSDVLLFPTSPESPLKIILTQSLSILAVVEKQREIYFIGNVKFHLDEVSRLGTFVEIEAIGSDGTQGRERLLQQCQSFMRLLRISPEDLVAESYSDLLVRES
jgi:predicted adenylyl cyclase CyaB